MRHIREVFAPALQRRHVAARYCSQPGPSPERGLQVPQSNSPRRPDPAVAAGVGWRRLAREPPVSAAFRSAQRRASASGLGARASRASASERHADAVVGGVLRRKVPTVSAMRGSTNYKAWAGRLKPTVRPVHVAGGEAGSSTNPATPWRWLTGSAMKCAGRRSSSPCSAPRTTPTPRPALPKACRTGSPRTLGLCLFR